MCMSVLCLRGGCIFCVTFPVLAFSDLFCAFVWRGILCMLYHLARSSIHTSTDGSCCHTDYLDTSSGYI